MPFGYSNKIFSHPAVEYIPLLPLETYVLNGERTKSDTKYPQPLNKSPNILIFTGVMAKDVIPFLIQLEEFTLNPDSELGLILLNAQLETIKYRGNYVTVVATPCPGTDQVVKILTRYFYKPDLVFEVIDSITEKVCCQRKTNLPTIR